MIFVEEAQENVRAIACQICIHIIDDIPNIFQKV